MLKMYIYVGYQVISIINLNRLNEKKSAYEKLKYESSIIDQHLPAQTTPEILQEAKLKLWDLETCQSVHTGVDEHQICAGYNSGYVASCSVCNVLHVYTLLIYILCMLTSVKCIRVSVSRFQRLI